MSRFRSVMTWVVVAVASLIGGALAQFAMGSWAWAQPRGTQVVEAREFRVVDERGRLRATLGMAPDGPRLRLLGENDKPAVAAGVAADGSSFFNLFDRTGEGRIAGQAAPDGSAMLGITGVGASGGSVGFTARADGTMSLSISEEPRKPVVALAVRSDHTQYLVLGSDKSGPQCTLTVAPQQGTSQLQLGPEEGPQHLCLVSGLEGPYLHLGAHKTGAAARLEVSKGMPRLMALDDLDHPRALLGASNPGKYGLLLQDSAGVPRIMLAEDDGGTWGMVLADAKGKAFLSLPPGKP